MNEAVETQVTLPDGTVIKSARTAAAPMPDAVPVDVVDEAPPEADLEATVADLEQRVGAIEEMLGAQVSAQVAAMCDDAPLPSLG